MRTAGIPTTEPITDPCELPDVIAAALTTKREDQGIGPYEYHGARGVDRRMVDVVREGCVCVDIAAFPNPDDLPDEVDGSVECEDGEMLHFTAKKAGQPFVKDGVLVQEYEVE